MATQIIDAQMDVVPHREISRSREAAGGQASFGGPSLGDYMWSNEDRSEPFLTSLLGRSIAANVHKFPAALIPAKNIPNIFLHVVLRGNVRCEVSTRGRKSAVHAQPGTTILVRAIVTL
jgi:hypothetical protein